MRETGSGCVYEEYGDCEYAPREVVEADEERGMGGRDVLPAVAARPVLEASRERSVPDYFDAINICV